MFPSTAKGAGTHHLFEEFKTDIFFSFCCFSTLLLLLLLAFFWQNRSFIGILFPQQIKED